MDRQPLSYWVMVFVGGAAAGVFCWVFWSAFMAVWLGKHVLPILFGSGLFFGFSMWLMFTAMYALMFWSIRREAPPGDPVQSRDRIVQAAAKRRYRLEVDGGDYLRLKPGWGLIKPACAFVQVWFTPEATVLFGPWGIVRELHKQLIKP